MQLKSLTSWNPWRGLGGLPAAAWLLFAATLLNRMGSMAVPFMVLYLTEELGFSAGDAGLALSFYGAGSLVATTMGGYLCDRLGPPRVIGGSLFLAGILLFAFPLARNWPAAMAGAAFLALASEAFRPACMAMYAELVPPEQRKQAFILNRLAINMGLSIGPAAGGFLAELSLRAIFWMNGATAILAWLVLRIWRLPRTVPSGRPTGTPNAAGGPRSTSALKDPRLLYFLLCCIITATAFFQLEAALPLYLVDTLKLPKSAYGAVFTVNTLLVVLFEVRLNLATMHWKHKWNLALGSALLGIGFGAMYFCRDLWSNLATVVVWTAGEMILVPAMASYVTSIAPPDRRGEYLGFYSTSWGVAFTLGPWLGAEVLERFGPGAIWGGTLAVALLAAAMFTGVREEPAAASSEARGEAGEDR